MKNINNTVLSQQILKTDKLILINIMASKKYNFISDVCCRIDGTHNPSDYQVSSTCVFNIYLFNIDNLIVDGAWLWRDDHDISESVHMVITQLIQYSKKCTKSPNLVCGTLAVSSGISSYLGRSFKIVSSPLVPEATRRDHATTRCGLLTLLESLSMLRKTLKCKRIYNMII